MTSYAAVNSLVSLGAFDAIHRKELYRFFLSQKLPDGSFRVHVNGLVFSPQLTPRERLSQLLLRAGDLSPPQHAHAGVGRRRARVPAALPDIRGRVRRTSRNRGARRVHFLRGGGSEHLGVLGGLQRGGAGGRCGEELKRSDGCRVDSATWRAGSTVARTSWWTDATRGMWERQWR